MSSLQKRSGEQEEGNEDDRKRVRGDDFDSDLFKKCPWCVQLIANKWYQQHLLNCRYNPNLFTMLNSSSNPTFQGNRTRNNDPSNQSFSIQPRITAGSSKTGQNTPLKFDFNAKSVLTDDILRLSVMLKRIVNRRRLTDVAYKEITDWGNEIISTFDKDHEFIYSPRRTKRSMASNIFPLKRQHFDVCPSGCKLYLKDDINEKCDFCEEPRYKSTSDSGDSTIRNPRSTMRMLLVSDQLAMMDIFDGELYQRLKNEDGIFDNELDIALGLYVDGFDLFNNRQRSMTIFHFVIYNFNPLIRNENRNMMQVALAGGPKAPRNIDSFLKPIVDDLKNLEEKRMDVEISTSSGKKVVYVKAHLIFATGDMQAVKYLVHHSGPSSFFGCRICLVKGEHNEKGTGMYFVDRDGLYKTWRDKDSFVNGDDRNGLKGSNMFAQLKCFQGPEFFGLDETHLFGHGIVSQLYELFNGTKYIMNGKENPFAADMEIIMEEVKSSRYQIPTSFDSS
ncbi:hypothetical protein INT45_013815 [Circinella minor]|uniref:Uncharacterized protein n=1 Tax=Circinella minor TaxID=1195481 RepID=A0A8H7VHM0_9FUNG|nr:hypothetical protein INT45_013815 [Circinella minor]